jgi:hypothetical protein
MSSFPLTNSYFQDCYCTTNQFTFAQAVALGGFMLHLCFQTALLGKTKNRELGSPVKKNHKGGKSILYV